MGLFITVFVWAWPGNKANLPHASAVCLYMRRPHELVHMVSVDNALQAKYIGVITQASNILLILQSTEGMSVDVVLHLAHNLQLLATQFF